MQADFSAKTFASSNVDKAKKDNLKLPNKQAGWHCTPFSIGHWPSWWDRWWCWGWRGYLPTSRISAEIAKRRCKPSVDFVKRQLLLGGFSNCLERGRALLLSRLRLEFAAKMNWELFAFSKSWQSELGSLQGLTLLSKPSLIQFPRHDNLWRSLRRACASVLASPSYIYTTIYAPSSKIHPDHTLGIASYNWKGRKMFLPSNFSNFCESRQKLKWTSHRFREG